MTPCGPDRHDEGIGHTPLETTHTLSDHEILNPQYTVNPRSSTADAGQSLRDSPVSQYQFRGSHRRGCITIRSVPAHDLRCARASTVSSRMEKHAQLFVIPSRPPGRWSPVYQRTVAGLTTISGKRFRIRLWALSHDLALQIYGVAQRTLAINSDTSDTQREFHAVASRELRL